MSTPKMPPKNLGGTIPSSKRVSPPSNPSDIADVMCQNKEYNPPKYIEEESVVPTLRTIAKIIGTAGIIYISFLIVSNVYNGILTSDIDASKTNAINLSEIPIASESIMGFLPLLMWTISLVGVLIILYEGAR